MKADFQTAKSGPKKEEERKQGYFFTLNVTKISRSLHNFQKQQDYNHVLLVV